MPLPQGRTSSLIELKCLLIFLKSLEKSIKTNQLKLIKKQLKIIEFHLKIEDFISISSHSHPLKLFGLCLDRLRLKNEGDSHSPANFLCSVKRCQVRSPTCN